MKYPQKKDNVSGNCWYDKEPLAKQSFYSIIKKVFFPLNFIELNFSLLQRRISSNCQNDLENYLND